MHSSGIPNPTHYLVESGLTKLNSTEAFVVNTLSLRFYYIGVAGRTRFFPARRSQVQSPPSFPKKHKRSNSRVQEHVNLPKHEGNNDGGNDTARHSNTEKLGRKKGILGISSGLLT